MSDEEKKAIIELNHFSNMTAYWKQEEYTNSEIDNYIKIILNLIEKQQKEIEELKDKNKKLQNKAKELIFEKQELTSSLLDSTPNDKIKAKIEESEKQQKEEPDAYLCIKVLQSLLEKE